MSARGVRFASCCSGKRSIRPHQRARFQTPCTILVAPVARSRSLASVGRCSVVGALSRPNAQMRPVAATVARKLQ
eukprot:6008466-Lingulodinium_polyedra.AAC.1